MMLYVIRTGQTIWQEQDRLESSEGTPLTAAGSASMVEVAQKLADRNIQIVYAGPGESEQQAASLFASQLGVKAKPVDYLKEVDYGLWQGLTRDELKRRQEKVWRQWLDSPSTVQPPEGETLQEIHERLTQILGDILKKHAGEAVAVVLQPVVLGVFRCIIEGQPLDKVWEMSPADFTWCSYNLGGQNA